MSTVVMNKRDELIMKLVHYFITEENYNPIVVNGVKDEIWLENDNGPYRIIRINSNNIFNKEQLRYDYFKTESIVRQIKKKTLSFNVNTLTIFLDVNEDLEIEERKHIETATIFNNDPHIISENILAAFPDINEKLLNDTNGIDLIINVTKDINEKTERENKSYEETFKPKKIIVTPILIALCFIVFFGLEIFAFGSIKDLFGVTNIAALLSGALYKAEVGNGQIWRLVTYIFVHGSILHLLVNMYSLYVVGTQIETYVGKVKYLIIFLVSGICGGLLSCLLSSGFSVGASGAIFGLLGALAYFGYHYRLYLGNVLKSEIIPLIILNLGIGFVLPGIDNFCHIGGLVGGLFASMAVGIKNKTTKSEQINGAICLAIFIAFTTYLAFFR